MSDYVLYNVYAWKEHLEHEAERVGEGLYYEDAVDCRNYWLNIGPEWDAMIVQADYDPGFI